MDLKEIKRLQNLRVLEEDLHLSGIRFIAGIDEVGKGCLAGPIISSSVILDIRKSYICEIDDSKRLSEKQRNALFEIITRDCICWSVAGVSALEIDKTDILSANRVSMRKAIKKLKIKPEIVLSDNLIFECDYKVLPITKGDRSSISIAAASIVAKVIRDRIMYRFAKIYPDYGFDKNKGYGTAEHLKMLQKYGPCKIHRVSFKGVLN